MRWIALASTLFLSLVFLYAGIDKAVHYDGFINALGSYAVVPSSLAPGLAPAVILLEILLALGLLLPSKRAAAALAGALMLGAFTVALVVNLIFAPGSVCGCWFSITLAESDGGHIFLNLILMGLALTLWAQGRERATPAADGGADGPGESLGRQSPALSSAP